jgi:chloramphenicol 3-O-phosphotransferase
MKSSGQIILINGVSGSGKSTLCQQMKTVHKDMHYDLHLDTGHLSAARCADQVIRYLDCGTKPTAFANLCKVYSHET